MIQHGYHGPSAMKNCHQIDESKPLKWKQSEEIIRIKKPIDLKIDFI